MASFERRLPLHFEPVSASPSDIIVPDSDDENTYRHPAKRRRVEEMGRRYLCGQTLEIFSARLKGPFGKDWVNPWTKRNTIKTAVYKYADREKKYQRGDAGKAGQRGVINPGTAGETKNRSILNVSKPRVKDDPEQGSFAERARARTVTGLPGRDGAGQSGQEWLPQLDHRRNDIKRTADGVGARTSSRPNALEDEFRFQDAEDMFDSEVKNEMGQDHLQSNGVKQPSHPELKDASRNVVATPTDVSAFNPQPPNAGGYTGVLVPAESTGSGTDGQVQSRSPDGDDEHMLQPHQASGFVGNAVVSVQEVDLREADEETRESFQQAKALSYFAASQGSRGNSRHPSRAPSMAAFLPSPVEPNHESSLGQRRGLNSARSFTGAVPSRKSTLEQFSMSQPVTTRTSSKLESDARDAQRPRSSPLKSPPHSLHTLQPSRTSLGNSMTSLPSAAKGARPFPPDGKSAKPEPPAQVDIPRTQLSTPESPPVQDSDASTPSNHDLDGEKGHVTILSPKRAPASPPGHGALDRRIPSADARTTKREGGGAGGMDTQTLWDAVSPGALNAIKKKYRSSRGPRRPSPTRRRDEEHDALEPPTGVLKRSLHGGRQTRLTTAGSPRGTPTAPGGGEGGGEGEDMNSVIDEMMGGVLDPWDVETELKKQQASRRRSTNTVHTGTVRTR